MSALTAGSAVRPTAGRRRTVIGAVAAAIVLKGLAAAAAIYISTSEPLSPGGGVRGVEGPRGRMESVGGQPAHLLRHDLGETVRAEFPIRNDGPFALTVKSLLPERQRTPEDFPLTSVRDFYASNDDFVQRFIPISRGAVIQPGETVQFAVDYVFGSCKLYERGSSEIHSTVPVTYSVFGIDKTTSFDIGFDLVVRSRGGGKCL